MSQQELNKSLGYFPLIALGVSGVVGSGWIYTNGSFFADYGAGGMIFGLALGSILAAFVALAYAQLTSLFPRAGGEVVFGYTLMGRRWGFWAGWLIIGAYVSSLAFYFTAFGNLMDRVLPFMHLIPLYEIAGEPVTLPVLISGVILTLLFLGLNYFGVSLGGQLQVLLFAALLFIGFCLVVVGFTQGSVDNFWPAFTDDQNPVTNIIRFIVPGMTYMAGFGLVATLAEDANLPPKKIGNLVVLTVLLAGSFYCIVLMSSAWILPWEEVAGMDQGTISAFTEAGFPLLGWGAFAIAILGLLTSFLGLYMATSRVIVAMARVELLPRSLAKLDPKRGTPKNALLCVSAITVALGWLGPGAIGWFLDTGGIYLGLVWVIVVLAQARLFKVFPHLAKKTRAGSRLLPTIGAVGAVLVILFALFPGSPKSLIWPAEYVILVLWFALGIFFYAVSSKRATITEDQALYDLLGEYKDTLEEVKVNPAATDTNFSTGDIKPDVS
ncbi:APC family permease [Corynebacterium endometrii]|uniref:GABA permease n=1 Tax=Corynebacterium endometrii TaxID=2488819 RepID=A0A4P7QDE8_9CORY|nr:APC family permease [Corynebacterium endometrii]QCB27383.1 GABA permease [Corynebacterium endometrii]